MSTDTASDRRYVKTEQDPAYAGTPLLFKHPDDEEWFRVLGIYSGFDTKQTVVIYGDLEDGAYSDYLAVPVESMQLEFIHDVPEDLDPHIETEPADEIVATLPSIPAHPANTQTAATVPSCVDPSSYSPNATPESTVDDDQREAVFQNNDYVMADAADPVVAHDALFFCHPDREEWVEILDVYTEIEASLVLYIYGHATTGQYLGYYEGFYPDHSLGIFATRTNSSDLGSNIRPADDLVSELLKDRDHSLDEFARSGR